MIVLDTNVFREMTNRRPDPNVRAWLRGADEASLCLCAPVLLEIEFGMRIHELRKEGSRLRANFEALRARFFPEVLPFDENAARQAARAYAELAHIGLRQSPGDMFIAGVCMSHGAALATRNVRHFERLGIEIINPFEPA